MTSFNEQHLQSSSQPTACTGHEEMHVIPAGPKATTFVGVASAEAGSAGSSGTGEGLEEASVLAVRLCVGDVTTVQGPLPLSSLAVEVSGSSSCEHPLQQNQGACSCTASSILQH